MVCQWSLSPLNQDRKIGSRLALLMAAMAPNQSKGLNYLKKKFPDFFFNLACVFISAEYRTGTKHGPFDLSLPFGPIIFLDAGLTAGLTKEGMERFGVLMGDIARGNVRNAADLFSEWTMTDDKAKKESFASKLSEIIDDALIWRGGKRREGVPKMHVGSLVRNVLLLTQREQIMLDSNFSSVIASLGIIEGLITQLDPEADFLSWGVPYLIRFRGLSMLNYLVRGKKSGKKSISDSDDSQTTKT